MARSVTQSLFKWIKTFPLTCPCDGIHHLTDGVIFAEVLNQIDRNHFTNDWLSKIKRDVGGNWRLKQSNMKKVLDAIQDYYTDALNMNVNPSSYPDVLLIARDCEELQIKKLMQLILGCAVNCSQKDKHISAMMHLEEEVQTDMMQAITELEARAIGAYGEDSQLKRALDQLEAANQAKDEVSQKCHDLEMQVIEMRMEKEALQTEIDRLVNSIKSSHRDIRESQDSLDTEYIVRLQQKIEALEDNLFKSESAKDEMRDKIEILEKEIHDLRLKNEELQLKANQLEGMRDELDVLRHMSEKVQKYETSIDVYKKKLEEMNEVKREAKAMEEKNTNYVKKVLMLEEEVKRLSSLKSQIDIYKKQLQELHITLTEETRRADKSDFEMKRLSERHAAICQEKDRLFEERNALKRTLEELKGLSNGSLLSIGDSLPRMKPNSVASELMASGDAPSQKELLLKLEQENEILRKRLSEENSAECQVLRSMLDDKEKRISELEEQNRSANQKVIKLEVMIDEMKNTDKDPGGIISSNIEFEETMKNKIRTIEGLNSELDELREKLRHAESMLSKKEQELSESESRYKKYVNKAKQAFKNLEPIANTNSCSPASSVSTASMDEINYLRSELQAKEKIIAELELESEKAKALKEMEERLMTVAVHNLSAQLQRKAAEERIQTTSMTTNGTAARSSFLARQRQATTRRSNLPGINPNDEVF